VRPRAGARAPVLATPTPEPTLVKAMGPAMPEPGPDPCVPRDEPSLWMLTTPGRPLPVGRLSPVLNGQAVALRYGPEWLRRGHALSEDLPLVDELFIPRHRHEAAGAVDDARPDRWGERVIRKFERAPRLSLLEFLLFAGPDRYGALGVSRRLDAYDPWPASPIPVLGDLPAMQGVIRKVLANEPVPAIERRLLRPGVSLGGARPKSLVEIDGEPWLVKFGEDEDTPLIEHAAMTLAARCGIDVAATRALPVRGRHAGAVRRFDRLAGGARVHAISAHVARLSPAFDVVPGLSGLGYQAMAVGRDGAASTLDNALSDAGAFGLRPSAAREIVRDVARTVHDWRGHFEAQGVGAADLATAARVGAPLTPSRTPSVSRARRRSTGRAWRRTSPDRPSPSAARRRPPGPIPSRGRCCSRPGSAGRSSGCRRPSPHGCAARCRRGRASPRPAPAGRPRTRRPTAAR
jgi:hypothetical protein